MEQDTVTHQLGEERRQGFGSITQVGIFIEQHGDELFGFSRSLVPTRELLQHPHLHFYHIFAALRLETLVQLMRVPGTQPAFATRT